jgi:hypothetical protein
MDLFKNLLAGLKSSPALDYTHFYVDSDEEPQFVSADKQYLRIWLRAARIVDVRRWTSKFHATVHGRFSYIDRLQGQREVVSVVAPDKSFEEMDARNLDRLIVVNQPLLGPIPYRGELAMEVGLFSVAATDLAKPYLDLLVSLTNTASVAFLGQAKPFIEPIRRGAELLFADNNRSELEIGLVRADVNVRVGNIVVARVPKGTITPTDLRLDPSDYRLLGKNKQPVTTFPYVVLGIEASTERSDYANIPEIRTGWEGVRQLASEGRPIDEIRQRFDTLRRTIWLSPDLIQPDKRRIVEIFNREMSDAGYDLAPPRELAALESMPIQVRALRDVDLVLESLRPDGALETVAAPGRISMEQLQEMMRDPDIPDTELKKYFTANPQTSKPFAPAIIPDPARVEVAPPADGLEGAMMMSWANGLSRLRRQEKFRRRRERGDRRIVLVSEGDSWFQFPIFLEDVIDQLFGTFSIWSVDAAGDTLQNMVLDNAEYLNALREHGSQVRALLFSGGGNDIVGEDASGKSVISQIVKHFEPGRIADWYIDTEEVTAKLRFIEECYRSVITNVRAEFPTLPVLCHAYDHAIPGGGPDDARNPFWAAKDKWIGRPMREDLGITDHPLQREIVKLLIDRLNERLKSLCGGNNPNGAFRNVWHVDVRRTVGTRWADELHPTDEGYKLVAQRFASVLRQALGGDDSIEPQARNPGDDAEVDLIERAGDWFESPLEAVRPWRVAKSLLALRQEVDRSRMSDGTIGDAAHAARTSDHNPWVIDANSGVVTAMDITHDQASGCDANELAKWLEQSRDSRIKYIIWNRRIMSSQTIQGVAAWTWRPYAGQNPHTKHLHVSVQPEKLLYDSELTWKVSDHANGHALA